MSSTCDQPLGLSAEGRLRCSGKLNLNQILTRTSLGTESQSDGESAALRAFGYRSRAAFSQVDYQAVLRLDWLHGKQTITKQLQIQPQFRVRTN